MLNKNKNELDQSKILDNFNPNLASQKELNKNPLFMKNNEKKVNYGGNIGKKGEYKKNSKNNFYDKKDPFLNEKDFEKYNEFKKSNEGNEKNNYQYQSKYQNKNKGKEKKGTKFLKGNRKQRKKEERKRKEKKEKNKISGENEKKEDFFNSINNDEEYTIEQQAKVEQKYEKEKDNNDFKKKYEDIIEEFKMLFIKEELTEEEICQIIKKVLIISTITIFEAMNLIWREVQIIETLKSINQSQNRQYGPNYDILDEEKGKNYCKKNLKEVIENYKIYSFGTENYDKKVPENYWLYINGSDRRRKLIKCNSNFFNYLPILNPNGNINFYNENDIYAKNENELLYHYLYYKTIICKYCDLSDEITKENDLCPYAHNILEDFRIIYNYKNEKICAFMKKLQENNLFHFENYLNYIPMNLSPDFNFDIFKVHKCLLDKNCPNDYHLCPYYHESIKGDEQRRPPKLFFYSSKLGDICSDKDNGKFYPNKCNFGIFCQYLHNKNEYNYHPKHFRKIIECTRKKVKGKCIYHKTCYGIHPNEIKDASSEEDEKEENFKISKEEIESGDDIREKKEEINMSLSIAKILICRKCQKVSNDGLCFFNQCSHFICINCFKNIYLEINKKNKQNNLFKCPFCKKELKKGRVIKALFSNKSNNV